MTPKPETERTEEKPVQAGSTRTNERIVEYVRQCWQQADDATEDRRAQWRELWDAYQGRQDTSNKAKWQSRLFVPKVWMHVEKASAQIRQAMLQTQKLFKLELDDSAERAQISTYRRALARSVQAEQQMAINGQIRAVRRSLADQMAQMNIDDARFKSDLQRTNLAPVYSEMVKVAFLLGLGVIKVGWHSVKKAAAYKHIDPFNFRICPDWEPTSGEEPPWIIERALMPLADLYEAAKSRNESMGEPVYDLKALDQLQADYVPTDQQEQDQRRGISPRNLPPGHVQLWFFWGNIPREDWKGYEGRKQMCVIANGRYLIRKGPNPFNHQKAPYILTMPLTYPFRGHSGSSLVEPIVRANYTYNNIINAWVDGLNFTVNKQFQVDPTKLLDSQQMTTMFPGKIWKVNSGADSRPVLQEIPVSPMGADALRGAELLAHDMQESTGVTDYFQGLPGRKAKTLGEIQLGTMQSKGLFDVTARDMEMFSLQPTLEMTYDIYEQCAGYPSRAGRYHVAANGVSAVMAQMQLLQAIGSVMMMALKNPVIARMTNIPDMFQRLLSIHNLSDCYQEPPETQVEALSPEQRDAMAGKAEQDAAAMVRNMSPEQIMQYAP